jgi:hypothetical protein
MILTYAIGAVGVFFAFQSLAGEGGIEVAAILAVGVTGILSFVRHAIFNRSDAANGGWDYGAVNYFQIEVGLANLAWGSFAILAVMMNWGQQALAASFLISGFYFAAVTSFILVSQDFKNRGLGGLIAIAIWAGLMITIGWGAMSNAGV